MKVCGILLVYSEEYRSKVEAEFKNFIQSLSADARILIINNGDILKSGDIKGDNSNQEFSGWETGLKQIDYDEFDFIFFANDTFCTRNAWNFFVKRRLNSALAKAIKMRSPVIIGEVSYFGEKYYIFGQSANFWIRTHIFCINKTALRRVGHVGLEANLLRQALSASELGKFSWGEGVSDNLIGRVEKWIFPGSGEFGWYRSKSSDIETKVRKGRAILNENWIAAYMSSNGVKVVDSGPGYIEKVVRRLYEKIRRFYCKN